MSATTSGTEPFGARLRAAMVRRGPLCVGVDPHADLLEAWGLPDSPDGLARFAETVVTALGSTVALLKPQVAFFERFGSCGFAVLERLVAQARELGTLVQMDAKRGDIGSTVEGYAAAYLDPAGPLRADAVTASPYLGFGSLRPLLDAARRHGGGVFVLALTSNPEGAQLQRARTADGRTVAQVVLDEIASCNAGMSPWGSVGAVIGATVRDPDYDLATVNGPLLAPGLGAQGATPADLARLFGSAAGSVVPVSARQVLRAGPDPARLRAVAECLAAECAAALGAP